MNVFDKIREKLEDAEDRWTRNRYEDDYELGYFSALETAIEIVEEVEKECNEDVCEWKKVFDDDIDSEYKPLCTYDGFIEITGYFDYAYCPYCGKKIKVVE